MINPKNYIHYSPLQYLVVVVVLNPTSPAYISLGTQTSTGMTIDESAVKILVVTVFSSINCPVQVWV